MFFCDFGKDGKRGVPDKSAGDASKSIAVNWKTESRRNYQG